MPWKPTSSDIAWTKNLIRLVRDGATWGAPAMGTLIFDKRKKIIKLVDKNSDCDEEMLRRTKITFEAVGYTFVDETDGKGGGKGGDGVAGRYRR